MTRSDSRTALFDAACVLLSGAVAIALSAMPPGVGALAAPWPNVVIVVAFFWIVHRPEAIPLGVVFLLGIGRDLVAGQTVGAGLLPLVLTTLALRGALRGASDAPFAVRLAYFAGFAALALCGEWMLTALSRLSAPPWQAAALHYLATLAAYPIVSIVFRRVFRLGRARRAA